MNTRHIQSFLIVSAAFFAMTGPVHARGAKRTGGSRRADASDRAGAGRRRAAGRARHRSEGERALIRSRGRRAAPKRAERQKGGNRKIPALFLVPPICARR